MTGLGPTHDFDPAAVIEAAAESILITTTDLDPPGPIIVYVNPAFERMTGWPAAEIVGRSPRVLQGAETDKAIFRDLRDVLAAGGTWQGQTTNYRKDGTPFIMEWTIVPLAGSDGVVRHYLSVQRDVTERVETQRQRDEAVVTAYEAERRRSNLARYFSPRIVDLLAERNRPFGAPRRQAVAALFTDIVGFTAFASALAPEQVMELLRDFHARMEAVVFAHGGSLETVVGDEFLALFGVPEPGGQDASNALVCADAVLRDVAKWNAARVADGEPSVLVGVGLHYGTAVLGDIGSERRMVFTAVGNTINIASRLERLTRALNASLVVSQAVLDRVAEEDVSDKREAVGAILAKLSEAGPQMLRGRAEPVDVWTLPR